jgi:hypothetical protein
MSDFQVWTRHRDILGDWPSVMTWLWLLTLNLGWTTVFMGVGEGMTLRVGGVSDKTVIYGYGSCRTLTSAWLHCKLQTLLSTERAPYMKKKESNRHSKKFKIWSSAPKKARHQDELADWPSVKKYLEVELEYKKRRKIGRRSQMGAWQEERLADWPTVVIWPWLSLLTLNSRGLNLEVVRHMTRSSD